MKLFLTGMAVCAGLAIAGPAAAAGVESPSQALQGITIRGSMPPPFATEDRPLGDCTPPSDLKSCEALHKALRAAFTPRELGMLFGAATAYPEYRTSYDFLLDRYDQFLTDYQTLVGYTPVAMSGH